MTLPSTDRVFSDFPSTFRGETYRPGDDGYPALKRIWNTRRENDQPALIARATSAHDVKVAVDYAAERHIPIAVRSGGHGIEGYAMPHEALVIDLSLLKNIDVDPRTGHVRVDAGALLGEVNVATQKFGLAVPAGTVSQVGVAGLALGGGIGHLTRRFGATVDNIISIDVVTTDGRILTASEDENADLFWGMRGAGQNLAIATSFTFQAYSVGPEMIFGPLIFTPDTGIAFLAGLHDALAHSPRQLAISPIVRQAPAVPGLPPEAVGQTIVAAAVVYTGALDRFDEAMTEVRKLPTPMLDFVGPTTWVETGMALDREMPSGRRWYNGGAYLPELTGEIAGIALDQVMNSPADCEIHFPILGGALFDTPEDSMAFSRTGANWLYEVTGQWDSPEDDESYVNWIEKTGARLAPHTLGNGYVNLNPEHGPGGVRAMYGSAEKWQRIVQLKREWDPENLLSYNKNISPE